MKKKINTSLAIMILFLIIFIQGCATNLRKPEGSPQPAKVRFSEFQTVEMKHVNINPQFSSSGANQKALRKIDELLFTNMHQVFPNFQDAAKVYSQEKPEGRTLLIEPFIEEIKFIGGGARVWVGPMAGSSAVLMKVTYRNKTTGEIIADPEFYRDAGAMKGSFSVGVTDNLMLDEIVRDICSYTAQNR